MCSISLLLPGEHVSASSVRFSPSSDALQLHLYQINSSDSEPLPLSQEKSKPRRVERQIPSPAPILAPEAAIYNNDRISEEDEFLPTQLLEDDMFNEDLNWGSERFGLHPLAIFELMDEFNTIPFLIQRPSEFNKAFKSIADASRDISELRQSLAEHRRRLLGYWREHLTGATIEVNMNRVGHNGEISWQVLELIRRDGPQSQNYTESWKLPVSLQSLVEHLEYIHQTPLVRDVTKQSPIQANRPEPIPSPLPCFSTVSSLYEPLSPLMSLPTADNNFP